MIDLLFFDQFSLILKMLILYYKQKQIDKTMDFTFEQSAIVKSLNEQQESGNDISHIFNKNTKKIKRLSLTRKQLNDGSLERLSQSKWDSLIFVNLGQNQIGNKGCKIISKIKMPLIKQVYLSCNKIQKSGLWHLSKSQWKDIKNIDLNRNQLGADSIRMILSAHWQKLMYINLNKNRIQTEQLQKIILLDPKQLLTITNIPIKVDVVYKRMVRSMMKDKKSLVNFQLTYW